MNPPMPSTQKDSGHVLVITSLDPRVTPDLHWAMIKDDIRTLCPRGSHGPGRVNTGKFSCTVDMRTRGDAEAVVSRINSHGLPRLQGSRLLVHYLQTFPEGRTEVMSCNGGNTACRDGEHTFGVEDYFAQIQAILFEAGYGSIHPTANPHSGIVTPSYTASIPAPSSAVYSTFGESDYASSYTSSAEVPAYMDSNLYQQSIEQSMHQDLTSAYQQPYSIPEGYQLSPHTGLPVNTMAGTVETESKGVHISNLSYKVSEHDLQKFVKQYGQPVKIYLKKDSKGKSRGSAVATFKTANEASIAAGRLDGVKWKGFVLKAKIDRQSATAVQKERGPIIANGSTAV